MSLTVILNDRDVSGMVEKVEWSGSCEEVGRTCDITHINAPYDPVVKSLPAPKLGDYVTVIDETDGELFFGRVSGRERGSGYGTLTANCVEDSQRLLKNKVKYSFTNKTPEEIAGIILADYQFPVGELAQTGVTLKSLIINGDSIYDAIKKAYKQAEKQNGKHYLFAMRNRALQIRESGQEMVAYLIAEDRNITESHFSEKSDNVVNSVVICDGSGNRIGVVNDQESESLYGTFKEIYTQEEGVDASAAASEKLQGPEQSLSVTALGNNGCVAGCAIVLKDSATEQYGLFWVKNDKHTYQNGTHTMELELSFKELTTGGED